MTCKHCGEVVPSTGNQYANVIKHSKCAGTRKDQLVIWGIYAGLLAVIAIVIMEVTK